MAESCVGAVGRPGLDKGLDAATLFGGQARVGRPKVECMTDLSLHPSIGEVAPDTCVLAVGTVLSCDVLGGALPKGGFLSRAPDFTQVDSTHA